MFTTEFFTSRIWHKLLVAFAENRKIPAPVVELHCTDGTAFKVLRIWPRKSCLILEVYGTPREKTKIRLVPYEQIKYIDLKEEAGSQFKAKSSLGFKVEGSEKD